MAAWPGRSDPQQRLLPTFLFDVNQHVVQGIFDADQSQRFLASDVVLTAIALLPMIDYFVGELLQGLHRCSYIEAVNPVGPSRAGNVMNVHVGHGCGYYLAILVVDRVMEQRDIDGRLDSTRFSSFFQSQSRFRKKI